MGNESSQMQQPAASQLPTQPVPIDGIPHQHDSKMDAATEHEQSQSDLDRAQDSFVEHLINENPVGKLNKDKDLESRAKIRQALAERLELAESQLRRLTKKSKSGSRSSSLTPEQTRVVARSRLRTEKITAAMAKWDKETAKIVRKQKIRSSSGVTTNVAQEVQAANENDVETKSDLVGGKKRGAKRKKQAEATLPTLDIETAREDPAANEDGVETSHEPVEESKKRGAKRKKQTEATLPTLDSNAPKEKKRKRKTSKGQDEAQVSASNDQAREATNVPPLMDDNLEGPEAEPEEPEAEREKPSAEPETEIEQAAEKEVGEEQAEEEQAEAEQAEDEPGPMNASTEIPTPPESDHESPPAITEPSDGPNATHADAADIVLADASAGEQVENMKSKGKRKRPTAVNPSVEPEPPRKRVRKSQHLADDAEDFAPTVDSDDQRADNAGPSTKSTKASFHDVAAQMEWSERPTTSVGPFTAAERDIADRVFNEILRREHLSDAELRLKIKDWRNAGAFRVEIEAALPFRPKASVRKFCQRKYHMNERGPWTAEQDEALRNAYAHYPGEWTKLSDLVDRHPGDCKDRWTLHLQYGDKRETGPWSRDEEQKLMTAVKECISTIKKSNPDRAKDREYLESMISWKVVSEKLGLVRSSKTCREKFEKMKKRREQAKAREAEEKAKEEKEMSKKYANGAAAVQKFEIGDFYDVFTEIHQSFEDVDKEYHNEENVVYSVTAMKNPTSRFSLTARSSSIRRVALETALRDWQIDSKKFKRRLEKAETRPAQAKVLARWIEKQYKGRLPAMARTYMTDFIDKDIYEIIAMKKERKRKYRKDQEKRAKTKAGQAKTKVMSTEFVEDSSDDEYLDYKPEGDEDVDRDPESSGDEASKPSPRLQDYDKTIAAEAAEAARADDADDDNEVPKGDFERMLDAGSEQPEEHSSSEEEEKGAEEESEDDAAPFAKQEPRSDDADVNMDEIPESQVPPDAKPEAKALPSPTTRRLSHALSGTPKLAPKDFSKRCRKAGRS